MGRVDTDPPGTASFEPRRAMESRDIGTSEYGTLDGGARVSETEGTLRETGAKGPARSRQRSGQSRAR
ncbi:hypothetical protein [Haloarchaeobius litoreus]|uniref:Uncharacterized protein n=1 Tax=Haloarchaeobius litoreus TaxID=755306 RepID=A0ABD6DQW9_9EURY|nr:hypothetical protein [Haloarchaeobius litoreus]